MMHNSHSKPKKIHLIFILIFLIFAAACVPNVARLKEKGDVERLIEIIESDWKQSNWDRYDAAIALGEMGDKRAIVPLIEDLTYFRGFSRNGISYNDVIIESLIRLGEQYPAEIVDYVIGSGLYKGIWSEESERADDLSEVLIEIGPVIVVPLMAAVKAHQGDGAEQYALAILSEFDESIVPILEEAHNADPESAVIREALNNAAGYANIKMAAEAVCQGLTLPYAADYDPAGQGNRGVYIVGIETPWNNAVWEAYADDLADKTHLLQVVFCFEEIPVLIETCTYYGPNIDRYQNKADVTIVSAKTGEIIAENIFTSEPPRECQQEEDKELVLLEGVLDYDPIVEWLGQYVAP